MVAGLNEELGARTEIHTAACVESAFRILPRVTKLPRAAGRLSRVAWEPASSALAEASQMPQGVLKKQRNVKDIDVWFTEIYPRVEYHGSIFGWG
jgi:hypothetical protein